MENGAANPRNDKTCCGFALALVLCPADNAIIALSAGDFAYSNLQLFTISLLCSNLFSHAEHQPP